MPAERIRESRSEYVPPTPVREPRRLPRPKLSLVFEVAVALGTAILSVLLVLDQL